MRDYRPTGRDILVSISDPGQTPPVIVGFLARCNLYFYDVDKPLYTTELGLPIDPMLPISWDDAVIAVDFVRYHQHKADTLVVNCEAGISRSAGMAAALSHIFNLIPTDQEIFSCGRWIPNRYVNRQILEAANLYGPR